MATKSILKNVVIRDKKSVSRLVAALEHAAEKKAQPVSESRMFTVAGKDEIKKMFGKS